MGRSYRAALRLTLRQTAAAYGYTLSIASTSALLNAVHGSPRTGDLFLFVVGGLLGFAVLDALLQAAPVGEEVPANAAFPFAGALNVVAVSGALGAALAVGHLLSTHLAWFAAPLAATAAYMLLVAAQVTAVGAMRE